MTNTHMVKHTGCTFKERLLSSEARRPRPQNERQRHNETQTIGAPRGPRPCLCSSAQQHRRANTTTHDGRNKRASARSVTPRHFESPRDATKPQTRNGRGGSEINPPKTRPNFGSCADSNPEIPRVKGGRYSAPDHRRRGTSQLRGVHLCTVATLRCSTNVPGK